MNAFITALYRYVVPTRIKQGLFRAALTTLPEAAVDRLCFDHEIASMTMSLRQLKRLGFAPNAIIDVGAFRGEWTRLIESIYPAASILMIEPQAHPSRS